MTSEQLTLPLPDLGVYSTIGRGLGADRIVALGEALVAQALVRGDVQAMSGGRCKRSRARLTTHSSTAASCKPRSKR